MKTTKQTMTPGQQLEIAAKRVREAEEQGLSASTVARRWRAYFAAEDAAKAASWI